ncbi:MULTISPECIES: NAD(P)-dependent alcohol dehydrogenase [unclassified Chelatococcus]|uniref:NAD(P)-dependent alcohol dehydrogenase n=1 Tax=unclassified Chelatococcus TaxID=2638111 RepID=UPI001BD14116|nr:MULTISPECIES: NAD(P)-dependent alcohol dehydrogenase [unclassified Chelatococcus]MBS7700459.1 NAD(P)-dependent alcohol dehydrogenase [Chelatococcus sp. YT9]MBX3556255.1 NAD(P)-dependent alcohol dehydrogenase [Chelatococcus sp.]
MRIEAAIAYPETERFVLASVELEEPRETEVMVRLVATGICHTDLKMLHTPGTVPRPIVLGHEGAGIVAKVGSGVTKVKPGDHVVMSINSCGHCGNCRQSMPSYCEDLFARNFSGTRPDGTTALAREGEHLYSHFFGQSSLATYCIATERNVIPVPHDLPLETLAPLGCGIQTGAGAILNVLKPQPGSSIAIAGTGPVGLSAIMAAKLSGATTIVAVDTRDSRLEMAREMGATHAVNPVGQDLTAAIRAASGPTDWALDTTGNVDVVNGLVAALNPRGTCGVVSNGRSATPINFHPLIFGGRSITGIAQGGADPESFIPRMIALHREGKFPFDRMITRYAFRDLNKACDDAMSGEVLKPVVIF